MQTSFTTAPVEIDNQLDSLIPQLEDLDAALDGLLELRAATGEMGCQANFAEFLEALGFNEESIAQLIAAESNLKECFSSF
ncbi:hypothetical protein IQ250_04600 [Pseudanabaenaceae cyanobacterium LEGE 13415]|nr:hypothetical protein [Pseudanabaenaceae cyanobacterium LEGE 13415]